MAKVLKIALASLNYSAAAIALRPIPQATDKNFEVFFSTWVATLEKHGLLNIFTARPEADGTYTVCDGNTRLFVIKEAIARGNEKIAAMFADGIDVRVEEKSDLDMLSASIVGNATRRDAKPITYANGLKKMLVLDPTMTVEKLSTDTGLGVETIKKYLGLLDLPEEVKGLVDDRKVPIQNGLSLQKLKLEDQKNPEILQKAQTLTTDEFAAEVEKIVKQEREDRKASTTGKPVEFVPVFKMIKGDEIAKLWEDAKYAYEQDSSEYNRIRKEAFDQIFQADEKSIATQKAAWEKRVSEADAKKKLRESNREKLKAAEAIAMLINSGIKPEAATVQKVLDLCGTDFDKEESVQILRKFLS